ncbi:GNAT family N-acetyltransferase [Nocardioides marmorisolisilvae]|uniref:GNAT family N-acetyltransferase n=2 Tax=Nocardioides marmorisolisilvae TaxID=1542737 RepID=A0A3N0DXX9_9ACTN|nr:GNAT family N-acetyltransferase [Nocardioides marmorisolisilvae]
MAASEIAVLGRALIEEAYLLGDWNRPSFDISTSTIGVFEADQLLGYAEISGEARGDAAVHPDHLGRGIGTWLAHWMQQAARAQGQSAIGMPVPEGSPGERLLRHLGYQIRWESWLLAFPPGRAIAEVPLPEGYALRIAGEQDLEPAYHVVEDAFLEWSVRAKDSFEDWAAGVTGMPTYEPWNLQVVLAADGTVAGAVHVTLDSNAPIGFVDKVAVRADQRGKGLAKALLAAAFASAREHGAERSELSTDSRTGALDLYLGLGMEIDSTWVNLGITL